MSRLTRHARTRQEQRTIPPVVVDSILDFGEAERTAPTGGALSFWVAEARLDSRPARRGPADCEPFW